MSFHHLRYLALLVVLASLAPTACSADSGGSTAGKRITLQTRMTTEAKARSTFTTGFGWDVTLTKAIVAASGLYYFDGPPPTALLAPHKPSLRERIGSFFIGTAYAHPGHYQAGTALGQVDFGGSTALDLFASKPRELPDGEGVTGTYRSARFVLASKAPKDDTVAGHIAIAEGSAVEHDGSSRDPIHFRLLADYDDVSMNVNGGSVDGCVLDEASVEADGTITVEVRPTIWLNLVDFSKLEPGTEDAPTEAHDPGFSQGVTALSAYHFSYAD
ncbi:MAG TPA: hypothetical protein VHB79_35575 [Polyangiaceae bacterium]|nr:hypothetical protein [Polyangiaceae bacterium]